MRLFSFLLILLMSCTTAFQASAQGIIDTETLGETEAQQMNFITLQSDAAIAPTDLQLANNGVFINQVGNENIADVATPAADPVYGVSGPLGEHWRE